MSKRTPQAGDIWQGKGRWGTCKVLDNRLGIVAYWLRREDDPEGTPPRALCATVETFTRNRVLMWRKPDPRGNETLLRMLRAARYPKVAYFDDQGAMALDAVKVMRAAITDAINYVEDHR